jgi:membrane protease YdiL (CAAX protease family)
LDILAWDWFFALSILFAVPVFKGSGLERTLRYFMVVSGVLSLVGLLGVPLAIMKVEYWLTVRNIGIVGYALVAPVAFLLMGIVFGRSQREPELAVQRQVSNMRA